jgi:hypothetical protein
LDVNFESDDGLVGGENGDGLVGGGRHISIISFAGRVRA